MNAAELFTGPRIVPVVVIDDADLAVPLAEALLEGGLTAIEITLRTASGLASIENVASNVPDMLVGAGSVRIPAQVAEVQSAGARFAVCPGSSSSLLEAADAAKLPFIPGAVTASEALNLLQHGYTLQKFFPAELAGGASYLKALGAPIPEVNFMPTGGISPQNAADYLSLKNVACLGGSWIVPPAMLADRDFDGIRKLAAEAARLGS